MSYDQQVWSVKPFEASHLPSSAKWKHPLETQWVHEGTSWQMNVDANALGRQTKGLAYCATKNWLTTQDLSESVGAPPNAITMRPESVVNAAQQYPEAWPFGPPFAAQEK